MISDWKNSSISLIGDNRKKRSSVMKLVALGIVGIMTAKAIVGMPVSESIDVQNKPASFSQLQGMMDNSGKKLNELYGSEHTLFVYENDSQLKNVIQNMDSKYLEGMPTLSKMSEFRLETSEFIESRLGVNFNHGSILKANAYDNLMSPSKDRAENGAYVWSNRKESSSPFSFTDDVVILKDSGFQTLDEPHLYPRDASVAELKANTFFHEVTHGVAGEYNISNDFSLYENIITSESVADMGAALISLKHTGNLDDWNYIQKPLRLATAADAMHMTPEVVDRALEGITSDAVKNMSDREVMLYAKDRVAQAIETMMRKTHVNSNGRESSDWQLDLLKYSVYIDGYRDKDVQERDHRWLNKYTDNQADKMLQEFSLKAMESSINNLNYQGKTEQFEAQFIKSVEAHISKYQDHEVGAALNASLSQGHLDFHKFSEALGFHIDYEAQARRPSNELIMSSYHNSIVGSHSATQIQPVSIEANLSKSTTDRYLSKSVTPALNLDVSSSQGSPAPF